MIRHLVVARPVKKIDAHKEEAALKRIEDSTEEKPVMTDSGVIETLKDQAHTTSKVKESAKVKGEPTVAADGSVEKPVVKAEETKKTEKKPKKVSEKTRAEAKTRQKALDEQLEKLLSEEF